MQMSAIHPLVPRVVYVGAIAPVPMMPPIMPFGHGGFGYSYPSPYTPYCGYETYAFDTRMNMYSEYGMMNPYPASYGSPPSLWRVRRAVLRGLRYVRRPTQSRT